MDRWRRWVARMLGNDASLSVAGHPDGEAEVWRVTVEHRAVAFLKLHRVADKWRRERAILLRLATSSAATMVPRVLASDEAGMALLLSAMIGRCAHESAWSAEQTRALHEQAGRFRAVLDTLAVDEPNPMPVAEALTRRHRSWCKRARPSLEPALLARVEAAFDPACFTETSRRWCHRDLGPHNWIVEATASGPRLGVIDFGQARPDIWLVDVLKLQDHAWLQDPGLADAFWSGYGRRPDAREQQQMLQLALLHGLATATWGDQHEHLELSHLGREVLRRTLDRLASR